MVSTIRHAFWSAIATLLLVASPASALEAAEEPTAAAAPATPALHHAPITIAKPHMRLVLTADIEGPELVKRAVVVYRLHGDSTLHAVDLLRSPGKAAYAAAIPAAQVDAPSLEYAIELELEDGRTLAAFASRDAMHHVAVPVDYLDLREQALLQRLGGRRSVIATRAEYVTFVPPGADVSDHYWHVEGAYTYRPLRAVTEFTVKGGVYRATTPRSGIGRHTGMYYTAPALRLRMADSFHLELEGVTAVTQSGFQLGAGAELLIGDVYGSKLALGFETIHAFGTRLWSRLDISATRWLMVSPIVEAADFPYADRFGVRLLLSVSLDLGNGFGANLTGGYNAREMASGGGGAGLGLSYSF